MTAPSWETPIYIDDEGQIAEHTEDWLRAYALTPEQQELAVLREAVEALTSTRAPMSGGASRQRGAGDARSPKTAIPPDLLTAAEAAAVLRTSRRNLARWISTGRLRAVKGGAGGSSRVLVPRAAIAEFLAALEAA